jgi:hypothetical protein
MSNRPVGDITRGTAALLTIVLLIAALLAGGCGRGEGPEFTERKVIEILYEDLSTRVEALQGSAYCSAAFGSALSTQFFNALSVEPREDEEPGHLVSIELRAGSPCALSVSTSNARLEEVATYLGDDGDGGRIWWVRIGEWQWQVTESTKGVTARGLEADVVLWKLGCKCYYDSSYGYFVSYPPSWTGSEEDTGRFTITAPDPGLVSVTVDGAGGLDPGQSLADYCNAVETALPTYWNGAHSVELTKMDDESYRMDFGWTADEGNMHTRCYFRLHTGSVYEVRCSTLTEWFESYEGTFNGIYQAFSVSPDSL